MKIHQKRHILQGFPHISSYFLSNSGLPALSQGLRQLPRASRQQLLLVRRRGCGAVALGADGRAAQGPGDGLRVR